MFNFLLTQRPLPCISYFKFLEQNQLDWKEKKKKQTQSATLSSSISRIPISEIEFWFKRAFVLMASNSKHQSDHSKGQWKIERISKLSGRSQNPGLCGAGSWDSRWLDENVAVNFCEEGTERELWECCTLVWRTKFQVLPFCC